MNGLTERQRQVLQTIIRFFEREHRPPTTRELAAELRCHVKTVYQFIRALELKGYIERRKGHIHVPAKFREDSGIPIVGRVAAGTPITAIENREGMLSFNELFGTGDVFAVRVKGDSMKDAGILDGDWVIVQADMSVGNGDIAVCYLGEDEDVTVKRLYDRRDCYELIPANEAYKPIRVSGDAPHFRIAGKVVGVVRRL